MSRRSVALVLVTLFLVAATALQPARAAFTAVPVRLQVYNDGTVAVTQLLSVHANDTSVSLSLLASLIANPLATDQNGSSLYFQITGANMTVYTIGATAVTVSYETTALTSKQGTVWTLAFQELYEANVSLPQGSTVTSISGTPNSIVTANGSPLVVVSPGEWAIYYGVPVQIATSSIGTATTSTAASSSARVTLSSASTSTQTGATEINGPSASGATIRATFYLLSAAAVAVVGLLVLLLLRKKRRDKSIPTAPELRPDDAKVIEFISEKGGKVMEPEIRTKFALPKTSAWRQIKRLERLGHIKVTKIGSQNQIELVKGNRSF